MWVAGIMQGLMWREYGADGYLVNSFAETVAALHPMYVLRAFGGPALPRRCGHHGLQRLDDHRRALRDEAPMRDAAYDPAADRPLVAPVAQPAE
jgi:cytochrome c oxidase cbb3-type subunit I